MELTFHMSGHWPLGSLTCQIYKEKSDLTLNERSIYLLLSGAGKEARSESEREVESRIKIFVTVDTIWAWLYFLLYNSVTFTQCKIHPHNHSMANISYSAMWFEVFPNYTKLEIMAILYCLYFEKIQQQNIASNENWTRKISAMRVSCSPFWVSSCL